MSKSIWKTLGLDGPTSDGKAIRRAYAKALRTTRPDEDPDGFMALREAFDHAKNYASYHSKAFTYESDDMPDDEAGEDLWPEPAEGKPDEQATPSLEYDDDAISTSDYLRDDLEKAVPVLPAIEIAKTPVADDLQARADEADDFSVDLILDDSAKLLAGQRRNSKKAWEQLLARGQDLSLDDYNLFERRLLGQMLEHFGYYDMPPAPRKGLKKWLPKPRPKSRVTIDKDTGTLIFKSMGWNRWKSYPDYIQTELLHILYELGIKERPKVEETGSRAIFSEFRYVLKAFGIAVLFALLGNYLEPAADTSPPPAPLADSGNAKYGSYSYSEDSGEWSYELSGDHDELKSLKPGDVLVDRFELQFNDTEITSIFITIKGTDGKPDIDNIQTTRPIKDDPPEGIHSIMYLIAGIAGLFAIFRLFGFSIGLIIGVIGLIFREIGAIFRGVFR